MIVRARQDTNSPSWMACLPWVNVSSVFRKACTARSVTSPVSKNLVGFNGTRTPDTAYSKAALAGCFRNYAVATEGLGVFWQHFVVRRERANELW
jgi:hypothetical protein